jgi:Flagellar basal body-associated protein FliL.
VRDAVLAVLSAYELGDLTDVSKRDAIRHRVADAIEQSISGGRKGPDRVRGVYFLEFVIQ